MINAIKKTLLAGIGAAVITKEKVEAGLDELVSQGKLSAADARALARKLARDGRREFDTLSDDLGEKLHDLAVKSAREGQVRLRRLEARLRKFEQQEKARRTKTARRAQ
ncbi:MAG: phasin-related domain-containing protein [Verrucomicrobiota bacterium]